MKVIDFIEYQLVETKKNEKIGIDDSDKKIIEQVQNSVCTASPEEAKAIVNFLIEELIMLFNGNHVHATQSKDGLTLKLLFEFSRVPRNYDIISTYTRPTSSGRFIWLPPFIDRESYNNIISAIKETGIFNIYDEYVEELDSSKIWFEVFPEKLLNYQNTQAKAAKKL